MKILILASVLFLSSCALAPVKHDFPKVPNSFLEQPKELKIIPENSSFSVMLDAMLDNYTSYYMLAERIKSWQQWYLQQKQIFEEAK